MLQTPSTPDSLETSAEEEASPPPAYYDGGFGSPESELVPRLPEELTSIDGGIAWFMLVFSSGFMLMAVVVMVLFFRARNDFEIRARSAYLVMLTGLCFIVIVGMLMQLQVYVLFHCVVDAYATYMIFYFTVVCATSCYGARAIRLAVLYSPRARATMPWLISERNHVCACLLLGMASMSFPLYMTVVGGGSIAVTDFVGASVSHLWKVTIACQCMVAALYPLVRNVEDIFNIGLELRVMMLLQLLVTLGGRIGEQYGGADVARWINLDNTGCFGIITMFTVSVFHPIRQRLLYPLESSEPKLVRALDRRKRGGVGVGTSSSGTTSIWMPRGSEPPSPASSGGWTSGLLWTYERVAAAPELLAAFEEFSRKALCQESVLFLKEVTRFQADSADNVDAMNGVNGFGHQYLAFTDIVRKYIVDGSPEEVNISSTDKKTILDVYHGGKLRFYGLPAKDRRFVFTQAYAEVRFMLELNLMAKFVSTEGFQKALSDIREKASAPSPA